MEIQIWEHKWEKAINASCPVRQCLQSSTWDLLFKGLHGFKDGKTKCRMEALGWPNLVCHSSQLFAAEKDVLKAYLCEIDLENLEEWIG